MSGPNTFPVWVTLLAGRTSACVECDRGAMPSRDAGKACDQVRRTYNLRPTRRTAEQNPWIIYASMDKTLFLLLLLSVNPLRNFCCSLSFLIVSRWTINLRVTCLCIENWCILDFAACLLMSSCQTWWMFCLRCINKTVHSKN